jgi:cyclopropane fatty-acyl-phospholipid synthase-like methyltransferase
MNDKKPDPHANSAKKRRSHRSDSLAEARQLEAGSSHYRAFVGDPSQYDQISALQFGIMIALGLREHHTLLDIGCGSLGSGRLFIPYLLKGCYHGIEPEDWLVEDGIRFEVTEQQRQLKKPSFHTSRDFDLEHFGVSFDFILAHSVLTHVSQAQLNACLGKAKSVLKDDGLFAASFYWDGKTTYEDDAWKYPEFTSYPVGLVIKTAERHGLRGHPIAWARSYSHYWIAFSHAESERRHSWLEGVIEESNALRILELRRELNELQIEHDRLRHDFDNLKNCKKKETARKRTGK